MPIFHSKTWTLQNKNQKKIRSSANVIPPITGNNYEVSGYLRQLGKIFVLGLQ